MVFGKQNQIPFMKNTATYVIAIGAFQVIMTFSLTLKKKQKEMGIK